MFKVLWLIFFNSVAMEALTYSATLHQSNNYCVGQKFGEFVANPSDCKFFYWCGENGQALKAVCPQNMLFNAQTKICENPENVQCDYAADPSIAISSSPASVTTDMPLHEEHYCYNLYATQGSSQALVFLPHPHKCELYYLCYHGQALLHSCSSNLHWNSKLGKCDLPASSECVSAGLTESEEEETEELPNLDESLWGNRVKCPSYGEYIFPDVQRCDAFIYCVKGIALLQICPFYQFFDVETTRCKWRSKAVCVKDLKVTS